MEIVRKILAITAALLLFFVSGSEARDVSVLIKQNARQCTLAGTAYYISAAGGAPLPEMNGQLTLSANGSQLVGGNVSCNMPAEIYSNNPITVNGVTYRGRILLDGSSGSFNIVNTVDINDYLKGVLGTEMSPAWPLEALKAQAVLARTYVMETKRHGKYDICSGGHCQNYNGMKGESASLTEAVNSTEDEILKYGGRPASVHYFSDSGGSTSSAMSVWHKNIPYLTAKPDPVPSKGPRSRWQATFTMQKIASCLEAAGVRTGAISSLRIAERDEGGRVTKIEVTGSAGRSVIEGTKFRAALGIGSTCFDFSGGGATSGVSSGGSYTNPAAQAIYSAYAPAVTRSAPSANADASTMPENEEDILYWMGKNKIFSLQELVSMIGKHSEYPKYIAEGKRRMAAGGGQPAAPQVKAAPVPQPAPAPGASLSNGAASGYSVTISGRGYGHGVGMPQWTAKALAESGWDYRRILDYYFTGTTLEKAGY